MPDQYFGKYTGVVKDNRDEDKLGQLQVSVPAIFPAEELMLARPALPYGHFFIPENEAKVWVEFEGGDPGLPLWTGIQYIPGEWAPEASADPPQLRVIKTAAGHLLIFNDKSGEESIQIKDGANGHTIILDKNGIEIKDGVSQHQVTLNSQGIEMKDGLNQNELKMSSSGATLSTVSGVKVELTPTGVTVTGGTGIVNVTGSKINLSASAAMPVLRATLDQGIGNLGAPVPLIGPGNPTVWA